MELEHNGSPANRAIHFVQASISNDWQDFQGKGSGHKTNNSEIYEKKKVITPIHNRSQQNSKDDKMMKV